MRHPAFHMSAKLMRSVSSMTGFLKQCACGSNFASKDFLTCNRKNVVYNPKSQSGMLIYEAIMYSVLVVLCMLFV